MSGINRCSPSHLVAIVCGFSNPPHKIVSSVSPLHTHISKKYSFSNWTFKWVCITAVIPQDTPKSIRHSHTQKHTGKQISHRRPHGNTVWKRAQIKWMFHRCGIRTIDDSLLFIFDVCLFVIHIICLIAISTHIIIVVENHIRTMPLSIYAHMIHIAHSLTISIGWVNGFSTVLK